MNQLNRPCIPLQMSHSTLEVGHSTRKQIVCGWYNSIVLSLAGNWRLLVSIRHSLLTIRRANVKYSYDTLVGRPLTTSEIQNQFFSYTTFYHERRRPGTPRLVRPCFGLIAGGCFLIRLPFARTGTKYSFELPVVALIQVKMFARHRAVFTIV